jgi:hypothetical protein
MSRPTSLAEINYPTLAAAFRHAKEIVDAGGGFTMRVVTRSGAVVEGYPPDTTIIEAPENGVLALNDGADDITFIPSHSIESITVRPV